MGKKVGNRHKSRHCTNYPSTNSSVATRLLTRILMIGEWAARYPHVKIYVSVSYTGLSKDHLRKCTAYEEQEDTSSALRYSVSRNFRLMHHPQQTCTRRWKYCVTTQEDTATSSLANEGTRPNQNQNQQMLHSYRTSMHENYTLLHTRFLYSARRTLITSHYASLLVSLSRHLTKPDLTMSRIHQHSSCNIKASDRHLHTLLKSDNQIEVRAFYRSNSCRAPSSALDRMEPQSLAIKQHSAGSWLEFSAVFYTNCRKARARNSVTNATVSEGCPQESGTIWMRVSSVE